MYCLDLLILWFGMNHMVHHQMCFSRLFSSGLFTEYLIDLFGIVFLAHRYDVKWGLINGLTAPPGVVT